MSNFYRRVEIDTEGNSAEPVNFVGVHPLRWNSDRTVQGNTPPDAGFVEAEAYEREFFLWHIEDANNYFPQRDENDNLVFWDMTQNKGITFDEMYIAWQREVKQ
jgi:hypothetical protein